MLRDARLHERGPVELDRLAREIKDPNFRIFVDAGRLHVISAGLHLHGTDPYELLARVQAASGRALDASHAFYLGYELAKARTALTLGKDYRQDEALDWGFLTVAEDSHAARRQQGAAAEPGSDE